MSANNVKLMLPTNNSVVSLHIPEHEEFWSQENIRAVEAITENIPIIQKRRQLQADYTRPAPVEFSWEDNSPYSGLGYVLIVSENEDLSNPIANITPDCHFSLYNLCIGTKYYWTVQKDGLYTEEIFSFTTEYLPPRALYFEGVANFRDMGGYKVPGGRTKQKMLYRGTAIDDDPYISNNGIAEFLKLGIKTEIDLRFESYNAPEHHSILEIYGINCLQLPIYAYGGAFSDDAKPYIKQIFEIFADESRYPIYFHCSAGADRTGTIAFLLGAVLGMSNQDLANDYELTSMCFVGARKRLDHDPKAGIEALKELCKGETYQELCRDYFISILGMQEETLDKICTLLIEKE